MTAAHFPAIELPSEVATLILAAIDGGAAPSSLCLVWRDRGATVVDRGALAGRLRRAGRHAMAQMVLRADVPTGRLLVFVDLVRGCNVTLASLPERPAPVVPPAPEPDLDVVLVPHRHRVAARRVYGQPHPAYARELDEARHRPGVPRGRCQP